MSDINLIISATDSASPVLKRINRQVDQFNRNGAKAQKSGRALSGAFKGLGVAAAAIGIGKLASGLVGTITKFESLKAGLKTVTGSAGQAAVAFKQIQDFTSTTPFQLDEVTSAFTILKRNGIDTSTDSLKAFGNIAAANGKSFEQLAEAVADGLTGEFERLKEFGIKVRKENDKFVASMGDTQVAASGSAKQLMEDLKSLGQEGGRYATGIGDQAATLGGKFSNLQDNISTFAANIGSGGLGSALKDTTDKLNGLFNGEGAGNFAKILGAGIGAAINVVVNRVSAMVDLFKLAFSAVSDAVKELWPAFYDTFNNVKLSVLVFLNDILGAFGLTFQDVVKFAKDGINMVINTFRALSEQWYKIVVNMPEIWKNGFTAIFQKLKQFYHQFQAFGQDLKTVWSKTIQFLATKFADFVANTGSIFNKAAEMLNLDPMFDTMSILAWASSFDGAVVRSEKAAKSFRTEAETAAKAATDAFGQIPDTVLSLKRLKEIYGIDNFKVIKDMIADASDETKAALSDFGFSIGGDVDIGKLLGFKNFQEEFNRLREEGKAEEEALAQALANTTAETDKNTGSTDKNNRSKGNALTYAQKLAKAYKDVIATVTKTTEQDKIQADLLPKINKAYADGTINLSQYSEALTKVGSNFEPLQVKAQRTADTIKASMAQMSGAITDQFFDMFTGVTSVFEGLANIAKMVLQMVMKAVIQAFIVKPLLAMMGIPMFANGGIASAGQPAIVGENGPELIVPNRDSRIFSNSQTKSMLNNQADSSVSTPMGNNSQKTIEVTKEPLTVNFNLTSVDTKSGVQFLLENKQTITGMVQSAYNQRGVRGPLG